MMTTNEYQEVGCVVASFYWQSQILDCSSYVKWSVEKLKHFVGFVGVRWLCNANGRHDSHTLHQANIGVDDQEWPHRLSILWRDRNANRTHAIELYRDLSASPFTELEKAKVTFVLKHMVGGLTIAVKKQQKAGNRIDKMAPLAIRHKLTETEQRVAVYMTEGLSTQDIARRQGSSARTVEKHMQAIYRKLDTKDKKRTVTFLLSLMNSDSL